MRVVVVDWDITYPMNSGKRLRTMNLMLQLADRHDITYFSRGDGGSPEGRQAQKFLNDHGIKTVFANVPVPAKSAWRYYGRLAANLIAKLPVAVTAHLSPEFEQALQDYAQSHEVGLWQLEWTPYVEVNMVKRVDRLQKVSPLRTLVVAHNVDTLIWQRYHETESNLVRRWFIKNQWQKMERFERGVFHHANGVVTVSADDAAILRQDFGVRNVDVIDNGVDVAHYQAVKAERNARELLFLGSLDWRANLDGIRVLLDDIFPRVLMDEPTAKLTIVGRQPPDWLVDRAKSSSQVELCANVPDVRPYLARAGMMVVPLRIGGGSRLKILEALASGLPVVATRIAAEGLRLSPDRDIRIADAAEEMAAAIIQWIRQPQEAAATARRGQEVVMNEYGWEKLAKELEVVWEKTMNL